MTYLCSWHLTMGNSWQLIDPDEARADVNDPQGRDLLRLRQVHGDVKIYSIGLTVLCHVGDHPIT